MVSVYKDKKLKKDGTKKEEKYLISLFMKKYYSIKKILSLIRLNLFRLLTRKQFELFEGNLKRCFYSELRKKNETSKS